MTVFEDADGGYNSPAMRGLVRGLCIAVIVLWVVLITVWLASNTVTALVRASNAVDDRARSKEGGLTKAEQDYLHSLMNR